MNRFLYLGLEVLMPMLRRLKPSLRRVSRCAREVTAGIDFDADLTFGIELEMFLREGEEILDLLGA